MVFWLLVIAVTAIACAALYYASAGRAVNAAAFGLEHAVEAHFRAALREIDTEIAGGRLEAAEAESARGELAREFIRQQNEARPGLGKAAARETIALPLAVLAVAVVAIGTYSFIGAPDLGSQPLAERTDIPADTVDIEALVETARQQLLATPDDLRTLEAAYAVFMRTGLFDEAVTVMRHRLDLLAPTADLETDLAEAILMQNGGDATGEPLALLESAAARDPDHVRSRFYLAAEATRIGDYGAAVAQWNEVLALASGDEPWLATARNGLAVATAGLAGNDGVDMDAIRGMVEGLSARLAAEGGTVAEWTQLIRSRLVLGETELAQATYDAARIAYPDAVDRAELDALALGAGLE